MRCSGSTLASAANVSLVVSETAGVPARDRTADSNSRRAKANSAHIDGASAGWPGVLLAANGLSTALTTPDTSRLTTPTACGGLGCGGLGEATTDGCVEAVGSDAAPPVRPIGSATALVSRLTASVVCSVVAATGSVASCLASAAADNGAGVRVLVGLAAAQSDPFDFGSLLGEPSSAGVPGDVSVSLGCSDLVVGAESSCLRPPVPTTTPGGAERTDRSFVTRTSVPVVAVLVAVVAPDESPSSPEALGLAVATSGPAVLLEAGDPAEPGESSAHASPLLHPLTMAAPTPKAIAKPPTRPMCASLGMRYLYRPGSTGVAGMRRSTPFCDVDVNTNGSATAVARRSGAGPGFAADQFDMLANMPGS